MTKETKQEKAADNHRGGRSVCGSAASCPVCFVAGTGPARGTTSYQHVCCVEVALAGHALFQLLRHLLDVLYLIQQIQDVFVLNPFDPQLAQLVPLAMQQHLARQQILLHLQATRQQIN